MKIVVGCEFSGKVRDACIALGHDAISCDCLPSETPGPHYQGDILRLLAERRFDLGIFHPPCTFLCNSGVQWLAPGGQLDAARHKQMMAACDFFAALYWAKVPRVAVENPVMHKHARDYLASAWKVPAQSMSFQPWEHGEPEVKRTCLWLRGLPDLRPSNVVAGRVARVHRASPGPNRWRERSRTLVGVANAMAAQWTF